MTSASPRKYQLVAPMNLYDWKQRGNIYVWRYDKNPRNYYGWHLTADSMGCESLIELLLEFMPSESGFFRTIRLAKPTHNQYRVPGCKNKIVAETKLVMSKSDISEDWDISNSEGKLKIHLGTDQIEKFVSGVNDVKNGKGDYSINGLWFWWNLD